MRPCANRSRQTTKQAVACRRLVEMKQLRVELRGHDASAVSVCVGGPLAGEIVEVERRRHGRELNASSRR
jgi:hypothetical protein